MKSTKIDHYPFEESEVAIYISGPMSGYPDRNVPIFMMAEKILTQMLPQAKVCNPATLRHFTSWERNLRRDIKAMVEADINFIIVLPGWKSSNGANLEAFMAVNVYNAKIIEMTFDGDEPIFEDITNETNLVIIQKD